MRRIGLIVLLIWVGMSAGFAQASWQKAAEEFQAKLDAEYADSAESPLTEEDRLAFKGLDFFPISKDYCVKAKLVLSTDAQPFDMPTVSGKTKKYIKYGDLIFKMKGIPCKLAVYQSLKLREDPEYKDHLFLLFKDESSGEETYGGGRYIDLTIPKGKTILLDFNQCYNPYCAYSTGWSCPIPPPENYLPLKVLAGVKAWGKGH